MKTSSLVQFLFLFICTTLLSFAGYSQSSSNKLVLVNSLNGKEKVIGSNEKISIWIGEEKHSGKYTLIGDSLIDIANQQFKLADITEIRANSRNTRIAGAVLMSVGGLPVLVGSVAAIADGGNTLLTPIALGIMTLGAPPIIAGSSLTFIKKKRALNEKWKLVIK
ncbi:MAG: hypothetical protein ABJG68_00370 [Crocinitomicaceae bacterium]